MTKRQGLVFVETTGSIVWFAMDASWMMGARIVALVLAVPTVLLALLVFRFIPQRGPSRTSGRASSAWAAWLVSAAMVAWACMNVLWMAHDFRMIGWGLVAGKTFLVLGSLFIALALAVGRAGALQILSARFRRLRLRA